MPFYEVTVTATRTVCVEAKDEDDAEERACDEFMEWDDPEAEILGELDEKENAEDIQQYKEQGELLKVRYAKDA